MTTWKYWESNCEGMIPSVYFPRRTQLHSIPYPFMGTVCHVEIHMKMAHTWPSMNLLGHVGTAVDLNPAIFFAAQQKLNLATSPNWSPATSLSVFGPLFYCP